MTTAPKKPRAICTPTRREISVAKTATAAEAIGILRPDTDTFILTYGQFSLMDAIVAVLDQTGPADLSLATWTAADADLERTAHLMEAASIRSLHMIVDGSFETRQPGYCQHMRNLFGDACIRAIKTHAKFVLIRSDTHDVVIKTSMNLNNNPRLENIEVSWSTPLAEFFQEIVDEIFEERPPGDFRQILPGLEGLREGFNFRPVRAGAIKLRDLKNVRTTHNIHD